MNKRILSDFLQIIQEINKGSVIPSQADSQTYISLNNENIGLFRSILPGGTKYYFFANLDNAENLDEAIANIEPIVIHTAKEKCGDLPPKPSDSYLICFWNVQDINENINKQVIKLEENEFYFKKYVFYYTNEEYEAFRKWFSQCRTDNSLLNQLENCFTKKSTDPKMKFITRFIIKVPCIKMQFNAQSLPSFDDLVSAHINKIKSSETRENTNKISSYLMESFSKNISADEIAQSLATLIEKEIGV